MNSPEPSHIEIDIPNSMDECIVPLEMQPEAEALARLYKEMTTNGPGAFISTLANPDHPHHFYAWALGRFWMGQELCRKKEMDYGRTWGELGSKGLWVNLKIKVGRLKNILWHGKAPQVEESVSDTLLDLVNYGMFAQFCEMTGNKDGSNWRG